MTVKDVIKDLPEELRPKAESILNDVTVCVEQHCRSLDIGHTKGVLKCMASWVGFLEAKAAKALQEKLSKPVPVDMSAKVTAHSSVKG